MMWGVRFIERWWRTDPSGVVVVATTILAPTIGMVVLRLAR